jgi:lambda repressor-like predicted transcriptional regulator
MVKSKKKQTEMFHIGAIICDRLKEEGRTKKWLATQVNYEHSCLCKILKKNYMDTDLLLRISLAMRYDFSTCLTAYYNENLPQK